MSRMTSEHFRSTAQSVMISMTVSGCAISNNATRLTSLRMFMANDELGMAARGKKDMRDTIIIKRCRNNTMHTNTHTF